MLSSEYVSSHIPDLVLTLGRTYDQNNLGRCMTKAVMLFSIPFEHGVFSIELDCAIYNCLCKCLCPYV